MCAQLVLLQSQISKNTETNKHQDNESLLHRFERHFMYNYGLNANKHQKAKKQPNTIELLKVRDCC